MYENESDSDVSGLGNDASVPGVTASDILRGLNLEVPPWALHFDGKDLIISRLPRAQFKLETSGP